MHTVDFPLLFHEPVKLGLINGFPLRNPNFSIGKPTLLHRTRKLLISRIQSESGLVFKYWTIGSKVMTLNEKRRKRFLAASICLVITGVQFGKSRAFECYTTILKLYNNVDIIIWIFLVRIRFWELHEKPEKIYMHIIFSFFFLRSICKNEWACGEVCLMKSDHF